MPLSRRQALMTVAGALAPGLRASVFPPGVTSRDAAALLKATAFVRGLDEAALTALVPVQSGLFFVGCPNCTNGKQENQLAWTEERPAEVYCRFCEHRYPSGKYPASTVLTVRNPRGEAHQYPYWADASGYRYYIAARRDDLVREYLSTQARNLARLYTATGDASHARRAAVILDQFAQVFPGWCYHYDYPFRQKVIYEGDVPPSSFRAGYRTARWTWWAYKDIPSPLAEAYDWIRESGGLDELSRERGVDVAQRIERDLFRNAAEQVLANPEDYGNMSPSMWNSAVRLGRIIGEPRYVHEPVRRLRTFIETRFMYDGVWPEGAPSYHAQTLNGLNSVLRSVRGYSDPPGHMDPRDGNRFDDLDLETAFPALALSNAALMSLVFPDGRAVPVHDTWSTDRRTAPARSQPFLLPSLGHACLGAGSGDQQIQLHLTWSGGYGHSHEDGLSLMLFAHGREMLSDLGYTHTRDRAWTLAGAAHNSVVVNGKAQPLGSVAAPTDGTLRWFDAADTRVQSVSARNERAYPGLATLYCRTVLMVDAGSGRRYAVDIFEVAGGSVHDYFLHGDADRPCTVTAPPEFEPLDSLLPEGYEWRAPRNEGEGIAPKDPYFAYGFLRNLRWRPAPAGAPLPVTFRGEGGPGLRVTLLPEADTRLILGENPSIRQAGEDDANLDSYMRPFLMLRRQSEMPGVFAAVIEPYAEAPFLESVERVEAPGRALVLRIRSNGRTDVIVYGADQPVTVRAGTREAVYSGDLGVLSLRGDEVEYACARGAGGWKRGDFELAGIAPSALPLAAIEGDTLVLAGAAELPAPGSTVRLVAPENWVYPFTVASAEAVGDTVRLRVVEGPGMAYDGAARRLRLTAFPQRSHAGAFTVEWAPAAYARI